MKVTTPQLRNRPGLRQESRGAAAAEVAAPARNSQAGGALAPTPTPTPTLRRSSRGIGGQAECSRGSPAPPRYARSGWAAGGRQPAGPTSFESCARCVASCHPGGGHGGTLTPGDRRAANLLAEATSAKFCASRQGVQAPVFGVETDTYDATARGGERGIAGLTPGASRRPRRLPRAPPAGTAALFGAQAERAPLYDYARRRGGQNGAAHSASPQRSVSTGLAPHQGATPCAVQGTSIRSLASIWQRGRRRGTSRPVPHAVGPVPLATPAPCRDRDGALIGLSGVGLCGAAADVAAVRQLRRAASRVAGVATARRPARLRLPPALPNSTVSHAISVSDPGTLVAVADLRCERRADATLRTVGRVQLILSFRDFSTLKTVSTTCRHKSSTEDRKTQSAPQQT